MEGQDPYLDTAVYHCQQAAEKAMKAFLTARDMVFEKTHNLVALLALCTPLEHGFEQWEEVAEMLTPYATEFRYPGTLLEPEKSEAEQALAAAEAFVEFIGQLLRDVVEP
jgi:HEPN domain-containing protein